MKGIDKNIAIILLIFIIVSLFMLAKHSFTFVGGENEAIGFLARAKGPFFQYDSFHGPGYSIGIRMLSLLNIQPFVAAKLVSLLFGIIFIYSSWLLLNLFGNSNKILVMTLISFNSYILIYSISVLSDMMAISLFHCSLVAFLGAKDKSTIYLMISGALLGLSFLTKPIFIIFLCMPIIYSFFTYKNGNLRHILISIILFFIGFLIITMPWFIFVTLEKGNPFYSKGYYAIEYNINKLQSDDARWAKYLPDQDKVKSIFELISVYKFIILKAWANSIKNLPLQISKLHFYVGIFFLSGILFWIKNMNIYKIVYLSLLVLYAFVISFFYVEERYLIIFVPLVSMSIMSLLENIPNKINITNIRIPKIPLKKILIIITIFLSIATSYIEIKAFFLTQAEEYKYVVKWLNNNVEKKVKILSSNPHIPFFSNNEGLMLHNYYNQNVDTDFVRKIIEKEKPDYFIFDERWGREEFPELEKYLSDSTNPAPDILTKMYYAKTPKKIIVYKINKD